MSAALLTVLKNGKEIKSVRLEGEVSLGRADGNVIRLDDRAISRRHAIFKEVADGIEVLRQSDLAPIKVNGAECTQALLRSGDVIEIGPYLVRVAESQSGAGSSVAAFAAPTAVPVPQTVTTQDLAPLGAPEMAPALEPMADLALEQSPQPTLSVEPESVASPFPSPSPSVQSEAIDPIPGFEFSDSASAAESAPVAADGMSLEPAGDGAADVAPMEVDVPSAMVTEDGATQVASASHLDAKLIFEAGAASQTEVSVGSQEVSLGRGSQCTVVLNDKKASRKHAIIRRAGVAFTIRDLESANGTFVNDAQIAPGTDVEIDGESKLQIGNVVFRLQVTSRDYAQQAQSFEPVPQVQEVPSIDPFSAPAPLAPLDAPLAPLAPLPQDSVLGGVPVGGEAAVPLTGIAGVGGAASGNKSLVAKFKALPPRTRILYILAFGAALYFGVEEGIIPPELLGMAPPQKVAEVKKPVAPKPADPATDGKTSATFESLRQEQKNFVEMQHGLAFEYFKNQDWDNAIYALDRIFQLVPDYKDSREIYNYAKQGKRKKEALEEEAKRIEEEARLKERVRVLVDETAVLMEAKQYEAATERFAEILSIDPDNPRIADWKKELEEFEEQKRIDAQRRQVLQQINAQAAARLQDGLAMTRKGAWYASIPVFKEVLEMQPTDRKVLSTAKSKIAQARAWIKAKRDPLLSEAKQLESEKQYAAAYKLYKKATKVDPSDRVAPAGIGRIRGILHEQSKVLYTEAVLAESYSDFETAERKYKAVLSTAPEDDLYYDRATRKLRRFVRLPASTEDEGGY